MASNNSSSESVHITVEAPEPAHNPFPSQPMPSSSHYSNAIPSSPSSHAFESPPMTPGSHFFAAGGFPSPTFGRTHSQENSPQMHFPFDRPFTRQPSTPEILQSPSSSTSRPGMHRQTQSALREAFTAPAVRETPSFMRVKKGDEKAPRPKSTMLDSDTVLSKPWVGKRDPHNRYAYFITYGVAFLGILASAARVYFGYLGTLVLTDSELCLVMDEQFASEESVFGENGKWMREVETSGFGNDEFEMTTGSTNNSFVKDGKLYIMPTLTEEVIGEQAIFDGYTFNLTGCTYNITHPKTTTALIPTVNSTTSTSINGTSSGNGTSIADTMSPEMKAYFQACSGVSNSTLGTVIQPVQSARISTRQSTSIRYGKVSVRAKLPTGDWLWPALWMLPVNETYGAWPRSGEIDIMESRGNGPDYQRQGSNWVRGSLNWGPSEQLNAVWRTYSAWRIRRSAYNYDFHDYVLEWSEKFIRIYVDTRLHYTLDMKLGQPFFDRGQFPKVMFNGTGAVQVSNPWVNGTASSAPFDQPFFLIMNVAAGGTNGWFPDNFGNKPWLDQSPTAMRDFALKKAEWYPTWPKSPENRAMIIDSVKMWQKCK